MARRFGKDDIEIFFEYGVHMPTRTLTVVSQAYEDDGGETGVDFCMAERVIKGLHLLESAAPGGDNPITIIMNNPGGDVTHGMAIYDAIKACKNFVTIKVKGNACSMGGYILQAADERIMTPNSVFMFHEGYEAHSNNHPQIIRNWMKYNDAMGKILDKILLDKINAKRDKDNKAHMSAAHFKKLNQFDTILTPEQAVEWGLCDKIEQPRS